ncbi:hypothetical protein [Streptomyces nigrescens]|uniref:hypothetical protein n=1 Tax=Streptomyces nigrescens TaxID=1920 RepID=UPI003700BB59
MIASRVAGSSHSARRPQGWLPLGTTSGAETADLPCISRDDSVARIIVPVFLDSALHSQG